MNLEFWAGKRVLLTGHTGFKGSWLSLWLQAMGAEVVGFALSPPTNPSLFKVAKVGQGMTSIIGDIRDLTNVLKVFTKYQPEIVFHMAAQPLVLNSYSDPVETYSTNVLGVVNILEGVRQTKSVKALVNVTTDKCYENREWVWGYRENDAIGGFDPYSSSKGCSELVTSAYRNSYFHSEKYQTHGVAIATARAGNVIGGGDWADDRLIPDIIRAIVSGKSVSIRNPQSIRPWQHVLEPLSGYLLLSQKLYEEGPGFAEAWNFGPNDDDVRSVDWIVDNLTSNWDKCTGWLLDEGSHPHEAHYLKLDCSKSKSRLSWKPRWSLATSIEQICIWHRAHMADEDMRAMCLNQIKQYEDA